jgi:hydrophobe/amphiphile efflux-1 (HAE1) family protein
MSEFFIKRPIFAAVISIIIVIGGVVAQTSLPISKFPEITPPTVQVTAFYPGANAQVVSETVAAPIEQEVNGVENMIYMSSVSADDGSYTLTVTFEIGVDIDMATVLVQNRVAIATPKLPEDVRRQGVTTKKQSTQIVQMITLTSDDPTHDGLFLANYANINIKDEVSRIKGVGSVKVFGGADYSMRIWLDPNKLKARSLTTEDVLKAIQEQNVQVAAGRIGEEPAPVGTAFQLVINTQGRLTTDDQFADIVIRTAEGGRITRVRDIVIDDETDPLSGAVRKGVQRGGKDYNLGSSFKGKPSTTMFVYQLPGANALDLADQITTRMEQLKERFPQKLRYDIPFDTTLFVRASVAEVYTTLIVAVVLVVLVIFIFLQDWRATIVPCVAIPVSLIGTFACMSGLGFSINMLTLFGIVLAIGIVVDDAIVVVENTTTHLNRGLNPRDAAIAAMNEITGPVIATTLVLLAVFVPTAFMGGITGELTRQFALTISAAVLISTINALTLSPALCGLILRASSEQKFFFFRWFNRSFDVTTGIYKSIITGMVRRIAIVMIIFVGMVAFTGWSFTRLPTGFLPLEDQGYCFVNVQLPDAASRQRTSRTLEKLDSIFADTPGVSDWLSVSGYSLLSGSNGSNQGLGVVMFKPWDERLTPAETQEGILAHLQAEFRKIDDAIVFAFPPPAIDGLGNASGFQMQIQDTGNMGLAQLQSIAEEVVADGNAQSGLTGMNTTFRANVPQLFVDIDRAKVKTLDIPLNVVFSTLQANLGSAYVNDFNEFGRTWQVRLQAGEKFRASADDIARLDVRNRNGDMIPLGTFIDVRESFGPQMVQRYNLYPSAQINGAPAAGYSSGQALALMEQLARSKNVAFAWTGMSFQEKQLTESTRIQDNPTFTLLLSIVLVFLVLAAQYESWTSPAAVIAVVPLSAIGVVAAVAISSTDINVYSQIGLVLLVALASKNAILIVEFASEQRRAGLSIREAASKAAELRFRAILMTAFSSILGFLPLIVATGAGAGSRVAVGLAVVGGMIAATCFSLLFVPSFFVLFQSLAEIRKKPEAEKTAE